ncbi:hypothetical protein Q9L58_008475 [Maublancomyces gigas]|uniref:Uncharacterized protein n=1 Tax=Discina gigas TaxID=1032678 RepID=A0ABR3G9L6_9PEZI
MVGGLVGGNHCFDTAIPLGSIESPIGADLSDVVTIGLVAAGRGLGDGGRFLGRILYGVLSVGALGSVIALGIVIALGMVVTIVSSVYRPRRAVAIDHYPLLVNDDDPISGLSRLSFEPRHDLDAIASSLSLTHPVLASVYEVSHFGRPRIDLEVYSGSEMWHYVE